MPEPRTISVSSDPALGVDGDDHRQLAVQLLALVLGKVARAAVLDLPAQLVVVDRVDLLARRRADVALLRPRVLLVDALLDLGQHLDQLAAPLFLLALVGRALLAQRIGRRQQRELAPDAASAAAAGSAAAARSASSSPRSTSPSSVSAEGGSGEVARPAAASPPPARLAWAIACAFSGASPERELTRTTSSGESSNMRLKPSGSTKRTPSSAPWKAIETPSATCSVEIAGGQRESHAGAAATGSASTPASWARRRSRSRAGRRCSASSSSPAAARRRRRRAVGVEARDHRRRDVERQQVDAPTRTRTALPRAELLGADGAKDQRQRVGADQRRPSSRSRRARARSFCVR